MNPIQRANIKVCTLSAECFYKVTQHGREVANASVGEILCLAGTYDYSLSRMDG